MSIQKTVDILLATYNGAAFLGDQLDSILGQSDPDWRLLIRDDGSSDGTPELIQTFAAAHPGRVSVIDDGQGNLGVIGNFAALMVSSAAEYAMFCDQDDVWLPDKIANSRAAMAALEARHGGDRPLLVHTDLRLVDDALRELQPSYFQYKMIDPAKARALEWLLVQNFAPGCTMMLNRTLCNLAVPFPKDVLMHDWWAIQIAASLGAVDCVVEPLVLYRQHADNAAGANMRPLRESIAELMRMPLAMRCLENQYLRNTQRQAAALLIEYGAQMAASVRQRTSRYATISRGNFFARRLDLVRYGFLQNRSIRRNINLFLFI